jgi:hypothetical protein
VECRITGGAAQWNAGLLVVLDIGMPDYWWCWTMECRITGGAGQWNAGLLVVLDNGMPDYWWCWTMEFQITGGAGQWNAGLEGSGLHLLCSPTKRLTLVLISSIRRHCFTE